MFCPEDGTRIEPYALATPSAQPYPPCTKCGTRYVYLSELGRYEVVGSDAWRDLYAPYCTCQPGEPDEECPVDGYGIFMRQKEYQLGRFIRARQQSVPKESVTNA